MSAPHVGPARRLARDLASGATTVEATLQELLSRIADREPLVRAWTHLDVDQARSSALRLDRVPLEQRSPLHGVPVGVKDIIDTYDMPTGYGSPIYHDHRPRADAAVVSDARRLGMLLVGKLVTTEFAAWPPGPTTNPHDPTRTPGGSSSGPAAAVAAGMVPVAFATQTTGSIVRPAAFCGVVGYKPTLGTLCCVGVKAISESFDTVGVLTRSVDDAGFVVAALSGRSWDVPLSAPPRLGVCLTHEWAAAQPETVSLFDTLPDRLRSAGAGVEPRVLPHGFAGLTEDQDTVWAFEIARCLADECHRFRESIREPLRSMLAEGRALPIARYEAARRRILVARDELPAVFHEIDVLITPSAPGEAPPLATTGDPIFNRVWSALGPPVLNVPAGHGPSGLPLGVQIIGPPGEDARTVACAAWVEAALQDEPHPALP